MDKGNTVTAISLKQWYEGDRKGLDALLERHLTWIRDRVHQRLGSLLRRKGETGDYVQETMVQILQYGPRFIIANEAQFRALLLRIVENTLRKQHRKHKALRRDAAREQPILSDTVLVLDVPDGSAETPSQVADRKEREAWIHLAMELLDPDDREIVELRQWEEIPFAEIAAHFEITEEAAQMRYIRAFRRLAKTVRALRNRDVDSALAESQI
jgi:RNA polymerase sigma-70 factor (ECF subfamily)